LPIAAVLSSGFWIWRLFLIRDLRAAYLIGGSLCLEKSERGYRDTR